MLLAPICISKIKTDVFIFRLKIYPECDKNSVYHGESFYSREVSVCYSIYEIKQLLADKHSHDPQDLKHN